LKLFSDFSPIMIFYHNKQVRSAFIKNTLIIICFRSNLEFMCCERTLMKWKLRWRKNQEQIQLWKC
jgi:hypothetical protein